MPMNPGPSPCSLRPVLPLTPVPGSGPTLTLQLGCLSQDSQPWAPVPAPSPSQTASFFPSPTGPVAPPPIIALPLPLPLPLPVLVPAPIPSAAGVSGLAVETAVPGQGGQRQPA